jgi:hypothetical protein
MYLCSKSYEKKYLKYKNKYQIFKSHIGGAKGTLSGGAQGTLLNGGNCDPLPNPEEEDLLSTQNLLDLCPEERITIQNKCYEIRNLYKWIIEGNHKKLPTTQTEITPEDKKRLIEAYKELLLLPNLRQVKSFYLSPKVHLANRGYWYCSRYLCQWHPW